MDTIKRLRDMIGGLAWARELASHDHWSPDRLRRHQTEQFSRLVRHAVAHAPFFARHYQGLDLTGDIDPRSLPITGKKIMMENYDELVTDRRVTLEAVTAHVAKLEGDPYFLGEHRVIASTGTSGLRGFFVYDRAAWRVVLGNTIRWNAMMGMRPRLPVRLRLASIGADNPIHVSARIPRSGDVGLFKVAHFEATQRIREIAAGLAAFRPDAILAYPSVAALIADEQIAGRLSIAPRVVSTHSEVLTDDMRARMREAWRVDPFNHYGLSEEPHLAADCDAHQGLHIFEDTSLVEVVDEDNRPVPDGMPGAKYLLTNLYNLVQPIIRYEITDLLTLSPDRCRCGRPYRLIATLGGRSEDVLWLPSSSGGAKTPITPLAIGMIVEAVDGIVEYTVAHGPERITVTIVQKDSANRDELSATVKGRLTGMISESGAISPPIDTIFLDELPRKTEKMGKVRPVSSA